MTVAGIGFRRGATVASVLDALARAGAEDAQQLALPARKADDPPARELAARGFVLVAIDEAVLAATVTPTQGAASLRHHATGSVAEACALALAGPGATLAGPRAISADRMATAALARPRHGDPA